MRLHKILYAKNYSFLGGKVNILGGHNIGHSKQKSVYVHVFYFELFPS
jgi:hypothetical protein